MSFLYVVGTPIGNLSDLSPRGREVLSEVDFIAAEDTRVTLKLLSHFGIAKPLVSYHEHNIREKGEAIVGRILNGENCAVVTDAGMPCISDPGEDLVRLCAERGVEVRVVPSPTAATSALAISGLATARFAFEGFLSVTKKQRRERLDEIKDDRRTLIFYEAPHKLKNTLDDLWKALGDRRIALCRELTKIHEEVLRGTISEMVDYYREREPRGEYVLVVAGAERKAEKASIPLAEACARAKALIAEGRKPSEACKAISKECGFSKSEIYAAIVEEK
ncbi:MAG: 16S rRNA (cytidine(1402)-2'-O)-methyltransferase [Bacteroides sp.]|nr:16S rRNA (cytidine(1402)-2'-O)-methyltransferase [Eubacterium sp.]MCM1418919.1 16S rRNA (cytidine(1402)-2'-O)-methyltransferase [Roseburia sp.]MCM1461528.1 16S rRNA (cytidine(1402)-2'-O)-methyltransferase [Bacteroides sp.]